MAGYIDVHCHLTGEEFDSVGGIEAVLDCLLRISVVYLFTAEIKLPSASCGSTENIFKKLRSS